MAENQTPVTESNNTNELAVRREKLAALTAAGAAWFARSEER